VSTYQFEIETARLRLRRFTLQDLDHLYLIRSDPEVMRFITGAPSTREEVVARLSKQMNSWQQHGFGHWAITAKDEPALMGWCGLDFLDNTPEVEVGYGLAKQYWGLGIATEAAEATLRYGFELPKLERIVAVAYPDNIGSIRVMEKLGMRYVKNGFYYGADLVYYEILCDDFQRSASKYILRDNSAT
jgi:RimJ/RimL family protein N-acetyltransferase